MTIQTLDSKHLRTFIESVCSDINECDSLPCQHDSVCEDHVAAYRCFCQPGYTGVNCELGQSLRAEAIIV